MRHRVFAILLGCILLLSACGQARNTDGGTPYDYYALAEEGSTLLELRWDVCPEDIDPVFFVAGRVLDTLRDEGLGGDAGSLVSFTLSEGTLSLLLTEEYAALEGYERTLADACLTLSLTAMEDIEGVVLSFTGQSAAAPLTLRAEDFLWGDLSVTAPAGGSVRFFSDASGRYAVPELRSLTLREDEAPERYLLMDLIAGPKKEGLLPVIPEGTELRGVSVENRICMVDFSESFVLRAAGTVSAARMTLGCVTATLCALPHVEAVILLVEGLPLEDYFGLDCRAPLSADPFIQTGGTQSSAYDINLYYPTREGTALWAVPVTLSAVGNEELARLAVELLCHGSLPLGMPSALPADARVQSVHAISDGYAVDFSAGFSRAEPPFAPELALQAIAHVLAQLNHGATVRFTQDGVLLTQYQGYDVPTRFRADNRYLGTE